MQVWQSNEMRLCCAAKTASALHHGGTFCWQAQHHDECPCGGSIKRLLCADRRGRAGMGNIKADRT
jgi:hypothetical protein